MVVQWDYYNGPVIKTIVTYNMHLLQLFKGLY